MADTKRVPPNPPSDFGLLADTIMTLKLCMNCGHQFNIDKTNKAVCPKCGKRPGLWLM